MSTILNKLNEKTSWEEFFKNRAETGHLSDKELACLRDYIDTQSYRHIAEGIIKGTYSFSLPLKKKISKGQTSKKRIIYLYNENEVWILKHLAFLLHKYDSLYSDNCYSFRKSRNAKTAIQRVLNIPGIDDMYCFKADIRDYFNSIPAERLCDKLSEFIKDDEPLVDFIRKILCVNKSIDTETGLIINENRGAMAGTPVSPFLANVYLNDVDKWFENEGIIYFRYADDILLFCESEEKLNHYRDILIRMVNEEGLSINKDKEYLYTPEDAWEFLGIRYSKGIIDISDNTYRKIRAKIKRKAHSLYRWRRKKDVSFEKTAFVMIRCFNNKFYDIDETTDFSWSKWFFPLINTSERLKEIDSYLIRYIRYLYSGRHFKGNYKVRYSAIRELGFRSLVNEYYNR
ncbi:MAG: reverse transcriptase/maturase family protein [Lachnospiraceae bacterium]|nr:reverse transcriptase/maturase family protein [Lachnospiraceae bacterium]